jgi:hypothetical protein
MEYFITGGVGSISSNIVDGLFIKGFLGERFLSGSILDKKICCTVKKDCLRTVLLRFDFEGSKVVTSS